MSSLASTWPSLTPSPTATNRAVIVASCSATISCSIFIASRMTTGAPAATAEPAAAGSATTVPVKGA